MSIAPIVLAQIGIMRKIHKSDSDCEIMFTILSREDREPDKIGLYSIQVMESEGWLEGFKWREENDDHGVFVLE